MTTMTMTRTDLTKPIGSEIGGVRLRDLDAADAEVICKLVAERGALVFPRPADVSRRSGGAGLEAR